MLSWRVMAASRRQNPMPRRSSLLALAMLSAAPLMISGCASTGLRSRASDSTQPSVSWEIRAGAREGDEDFVCGTKKPSPCVLPAKREARFNRTLVAVYLHATKQQANYLGLVQASFIEGRGQRLREVNITVPPGASPVGSSVLGLVTPQPGDYVLRIALDTIREGQPPVRIAENIDVTVR